MVIDQNTDTSTQIDDIRPHRRRGRAWKAARLGMCLKCGHKLTCCGAPFSGDIPCANCLYINTYR
jgi:hypothetical protein